LRFSARAFGSNSAEISRQGAPVTRKPDFGTPDLLRGLFAPLLRHPFEIVAFAYLDPQWRLLGARHSVGGMIGAITVPIRAVAADALVFDAAAVVMAHNHPSGDATPSAADRSMTKRLARMLDALGICLFDHLVITGDVVTSFRALGLL
jgi:DNA repair protein RadC